MRARHGNTQDGQICVAAPTGRCPSPKLWQTAESTAYNNTSKWQPPPGLVHHSDQGVRYASRAEVRWIDRSNCSLAIEFDWSLVVDASLPSCLAMISIATARKKREYLRLVLRSPSCAESDAGTDTRMGPLPLPDTRSLPPRTTFGDWGLSEMVLSPPGLLFLHARGRHKTLPRLTVSYR
jgi:hypothetical protein